MTHHRGLWREAAVALRALRATKVNVVLFPGKICCLKHSSSRELHVRQTLLKNHTVHPLTHQLRHVCFLEALKGHPAPHSYFATLETTVHNCQARAPNHAHSHQVRNTRSQKQRRRPQDIGLLRGENDFPGENSIPVGRSVYSKAALSPLPHPSSSANQNLAFLFFAEKCGSRATAPKVSCRLVCSPI